MNELETLVLQQIGEDTSSPDVFTDTSDGMDQIRTSLGHAIEDICILTGCVRRKYYIPLESGINFYQIENGRDYFAWFVMVWLVNQKRQLRQKDLVWMVNHDPRFLKVTATPTHYMPIGENKVCIYPTPGSHSDVLMIDAVVIPAKYSLDTDRIKIRKSFKWAAVHYAISEYWASRGDAGEATDQFGRFLELLGLSKLYPETAERKWQYQTDKK